MPTFDLIDEADDTAQNASIDCDRDKPRRSGKCAAVENIRIFLNSSWRLYCTFFVGQQFRMNLGVITLWDENSIIALRLNCQHPRYELYPAYFFAPVKRGYFGRIPICMTGFISIDVRDCTFHCFSSQLIIS
jgi:hypothetical protein